MTRFWNDETTNNGRAILIKVPLGLADPASNIPQSNPPTLEKWEIGKSIFFDRTIVSVPGSRLACASCHKPAKGFSDGEPAIDPLMRPPVLLNCVYGKEFFWDGRASGLENLLEGSFFNAHDVRFEDIRRYHIWVNALATIREDEVLAGKINEVFGGTPTRENVAQCLATYLRTILCGNSIQDRAEQVRAQRAGDSISVDDYAKVLDAATVASLDQLLQQADIGADKLEPARKQEIAQQLHLGYTLFNGKARCSRCHSGQDYTDRSYHNLGIRESAFAMKTGLEAGHYATDSSSDRFIGAFRTPTLRGLARSTPYFHNGSYPSLFSVIPRHIDRNVIPLTPHLDPELLDDKHNPINVHLPEVEIRALILFLYALEGDPTDDMVAKPPPRLR